MGGVQFCDLVFEKNDSNKGTYGTTELTLDLLTGLFFTLGSMSVYREDKSFATVAVLRLGLLLPFGRVYHYLNLYFGQGEWCGMVTGPEHCPTLPQCEPGAADDAQQVNGYGHPVCCAGYPCQWCGADSCAGEYWLSGVPKPAPSSCVAIKTGAKCTEDGDMYLAETVLFPQLAAQLFYCWLLSVLITQATRRHLDFVNQVPPERS